AVVVVCMGDDGKPVGPAPNSISDLHAAQVSGGRVRLEWSYCPLDQQAEPARFNVYAADGQFDFGAPLATIVYRGNRLYRHLTGALPEGEHHFVVRAQGANGIESDSIAVASCPVRAGDPEGVTILAAEAAL